MSFLRRSYTATHAPSASAIASSFLQRAHASPPITHSQILDSNQFARLAETLNRPRDLQAGNPSSAIKSSSPPLGAPLPPTHHLVYFTPSQLPEELGADGTDTSYNPPAPFTRRMWAGGEVKWEKDNLLRIGQMVKEETKVLSAEGKVTKRGEEMVVVGVEKRLENEEGLSVVDRRNWIFRAAITDPIPPTNVPELKFFPTAPHFRDFLQTPISLFRFSALTFNAHRIHYDRDWCRQIEGHRDIVVHGPLNLINMVDFWRDVKEETRGVKEEGVLVPKSVKYRATSPLYGGEIYRILMEEEKDSVTDVSIVDSYGNISMTGKIESF